jgi:hypothetical protein
MYALTRCVSLIRLRQSKKSAVQKMDDTISGNSNENSEWLLHPAKRGEQ